VSEPLNRDRIQSIERAAALLRAVAALPAGQASAGAVASACGLNPSTAWRILATLEDQGLLDRRGDAYVIGFGLAQLASAASSDAIVGRAHPVIERLAAVSGETTALALARRLGLYSVDQVAASGSSSESWHGRPVPLHATSAGKAFLAFLSPGMLDVALPTVLEPFTRTTVTSRERLLAELAETRVRGFATCIGELVPDEYGVAAPVLDGAGRPVAVVSIWGPSARVPVARLAVLGGLAIEAAGALQSVPGTA
jgi:DNA-binding IclR family transcriptional regulator